MYVYLYLCHRYMMKERWFQLRMRVHDLIQVQQTGM